MTGILPAGSTYFLPFLLTHSCQKVAMGSKYALLSTLLANLKVIVAYVSIALLVMYSFKVRSNLDRLFWTEASIHLFVHVKWALSRNVALILSSLFNELKTFPAIFKWDWERHWVIRDIKVGPLGLFNLFSPI